MNGADVALEAPGWLREFFSHENTLTWTDVEAGTSEWAASLRPWLQLACSGQANRGMVLLALDVNGQPTWYACADNPPDQDALAEQLECFLGPSLVTFDRTQAWSAVSACEKVLALQFAQGVRTFRPRAGASNHDVCDALAMLAGLLLRRPVRTRTAVRPFAVVRAEFDQALFTSDEILARRCIDELRASGRLNATNERFLYVRLMVALGRDAALVRDPLLMDALAEARLPIPIAVLRDVIEALYTVHLQPLGDGAAPEKLLEVYQREFRPYERLLRHRRGLRSPIVLRTLLLQEVALAQGKPATAQASQLLEELIPSAADAVWANRLLATLQATSVSPVAPVTPVDAPAPPTAMPAQSLVDWAGLPPSIAAAGGLLKAALDLGTLDAASQALASLRRFPAELLRGLSPLQQAMRQMLEQLVPQAPAAEAAPSALTDWTTWARWVATTPPSEESRCRAIAEQGAQEWNHAAWLAQTDLVEEFKQLLLKHAARFKPYLPLVQGSLLDITEQPLSQAGLLAQMATVVALDAPSPADLNLLGEWAGAVVRLGAGRQTCEEMASALRAAWDEVRSLRAFDWLCDSLEVMQAGPHSPDGELQALFQDLLSFAAGQQHRLSPLQHRVLGLLALDFGSQYTPLAHAPSPAMVAAPSYVGQSIGIYTLQESIVPHLRQALQEVFPGATTQFNHDHVASNALEHMARHSSVMIFAWKCSKHQAFFCIQKYRPPAMPLLQPHGRGSASILRALEEHFQLNPPGGA